MVTTARDPASAKMPGPRNPVLESQFPGGIRELHWHHVFKEDLWFFPAGRPHSLQGLGPVGAEFVLVFDDGSQSESNTLLLTD
jgi:hypothetical protein